MLATVTASGTFQVKTGAGYLNGVYVAAAGTTWTLQVKDGPDQNGNTKTMLGGTAVTVPTSGTELINQPLYFGQGLQFILSGATPGELDISFT
jgi:hypothetical protein